MVTKNAILPIFAAILATNRPQTSSTNKYGHHQGLESLVVARRYCVSYSMVCLVLKKR